MEGTHGDILEKISGRTLEKILAWIFLPYSLDHISLEYLKYLFEKFLQREIHGFSWCNAVRKKLPKYYFYIIYPD